LGKTDRLKKIKADTGAAELSGTALSKAFQKRLEAKPTTADNKTMTGLDILRQGDSLVKKNKSDGDGSKPLASGTINIQRLVNANVAETSSKAISAVSFHSSSNLLLATGADKFMRFFKVDGEDNELQLKVKFDMGVTNATFLGTSWQVAVAGRKPYFYIYDTPSGSTDKIAASSKEVKSLEHMFAAPDGGLLAFNGGRGYVHIFNNRSKSWMVDLKTNGPVRSVTFLDEYRVATSGTFSLSFHLFTTVTPVAVET
jgi:hypothetical protein